MSAKQTNTSDQEQGLHYPAVETARLPERLIFGNRLSILILFSLITVFLAFQAYQLKPEASFSKLIPQGHPFIQKMNSHLRDLQASGAGLKVKHCWSRLCQYRQSRRR